MYFLLQNHMHQVLEIWCVALPSKVILYQICVNEGPIVKMTLRQGPFSCDRNSIA